MGQRIEVYCEISVKKKYIKEAKEGFTIESNISGNHVSDKYFVSINYGDGKGWGWLKTHSDVEYTCDSQVEAMNYMSRQGWNMIKDYRSSDYYNNFKYDIVFRKEISS